MDLIYVDDPQIILPYVQSDGKSVDILIRPRWKRFWKVDSLLDLYKRYLDYANGPGKGRNYYSFIADMPGWGEGYQFNREGGPLKVFGEVLGLMNPLRIKFDEYLGGRNGKVPFSVEEEKTRIIITKLDNQDLIEEELNIPDKIRSTPELYNILKQAENL
jgi:hypothetical protein